MIGSRLAHYEVTSHLGSGGMGQVYQATDTKLSRSVALKLLPDAFAFDVERAARFEREARVLASLNHPNIAAIYGLENAGGKQFLVMELVPGETLAERIQRGPIPLEESLAIARQIAEALEAAHEKGVIHRDLKPANIKITADGAVKVLDFGLAKAFEPDASSPALSNSPTVLSMAATQQGVILGTAGYMSPEQAAGRPVDKRSDIWAFGVVLHEMLTGRQVFQGETVSHLLASVLKDAPDWRALPPNTPAALHRLLRRCLEKDRRKRLADAADIRLEIEDAATALTAPDAVAAPPAARAPSRGRWLLAAAALAVIAALGIPAVSHLRETPHPETRLDLVTPFTGAPEAFALSPDGQSIVYLAATEGTGAGSRLWLRSLASTTAQPLAGTEGGMAPFWAPDSRSIGFFAGGSLKRLDLDATTPQTLAPVQSPRGASWSVDGVILFAPTITSPLMRIAASGGAVTAATTFGAQDSGHLEPWFLPDGRRFLYLVRGAPDSAGIYLGALDGSAPTRITPSTSAGLYHPAGWLLWMRAGTLVAQRLDDAQKKLTGEPITLAEGVVENGLGRAGIAAAATGLLAYRLGEAGKRQLEWVDRSGKVTEALGPLDSTILGPSVAPVGRRVAVSRVVQGNSDIWLLDGPRLSRVTTDAANDIYPLWSPDGQITFRSTRSGVGDLYSTPASGAGSSERIVGADRLLTATGWSADGRFLMYMSNDPQSGMDLWVMPMAGDRKPFVFLQTPFREAYGAFSPDARWVAYQSNVSGRPEIYVRPFFPPDAAATGQKAEIEQQQASSMGGISPLWRHDGKELYYLDPDGAMIAVPATIKGAAMALGAPVRLFPTRIHGGGVDTQQGRQYGVASDGAFVINRVLDSAVGPITLVQNWIPAAQK